MVEREWRVRFAPTTPTFEEWVIEKGHWFHSRIYRLSVYTTTSSPGGRSPNAKLFNERTIVNDYDVRRVIVFHPAMLPSSISSKQSPCRLVVKQNIDEIEPRWHLRLAVAGMDLVSLVWESRFPRFIWENCLIPTRESGWVGEGYGTARGLTGLWQLSSVLAVG